MDKKGKKLQPADRLATQFGWTSPEYPLHQEPSPPKWTTEKSPCTTLWSLVSILMSKS